MGAAVLCASFMSFGVKRRWFAMAAAVQLAISTYASYVGEQVFYADWLKVSPSLVVRWVSRWSAGVLSVLSSRSGCTPGRWRWSEASWCWPAGPGRSTGRRLAAGPCSPPDRSSWGSTSSAWWDLQQSPAPSYQSTINQVLPRKFWITAKGISNFISRVICLDVIWIKQSINFYLYSY